MLRTVIEMVVQEENLKCIVEPFSRKNISLWTHLVEAVFAAEVLDKYLEEE